ncbi:hypothetical protein LguiB_003918 [Lonicera macranthoides]
MTNVAKRLGDRECCTGCGGGGAASVVVVEYLETTMSKDLLGKFPDNSAFDFDYSQSSIWSPLLSRNYYINSNSTNAGGTTNGSCGLQFLLGISSSSSSIQRKLSYDENYYEGEEENEGGLILSKNNNDNIMILKKLRDKIKKKITTTATVMMMKKKKKKKAFDLSPFKGVSASSTSVTPTPIKGWGKILRAASKQFKKKNTNRKDYSRSSHLLM